METFQESMRERRVEWTQRQREVLALIAKGRTNPEIAEALGISLAGAKWHVSEIMTTLGVDSRGEAAEYWRAENSLPRRFSNAVRALLGAGILKTVAVAGLVATVGGLGIATATAFVNGDGQSPVVEAAPAPTPTPVPPDPAANEGLTLRVIGTKIDDIQTTIDVVLEGRPELGRFAVPAFLNPGGEQLRDQFGNAYRQRAMGGSAANTRMLSFTFDAIAPSATTLTLTLADALFVNPASEVPEGQRPPDPSATIAGPWMVRIIEFAQKASARVPVDQTPRPFGTGSVVIDEIRQAETATVVYAHLVGFPEKEVYGLLLDWQLIDQSGVAAPYLVGRWGDGPENARIEWQFARTSGPAVLRLQGHAAPPIRAENITLAGPGITPVPGVVSEEAKEVRRQSAELAARLEVMFADALPAEWTVTLP